MHQDSDQKVRKVLWSRWHLSWTLKGEREGISDKESGIEVGRRVGFGGENTSFRRKMGVRSRAGCGSPQALATQKRIAFLTPTSSQQYTIPESRKYQRRMAAF